jgi:hypothetical protein
VVDASEFVSTFFDGETRDVEKRGGAWQAADAYE